MRKFNEKEKLIFKNSRNKKLEMSVFSTIFLDGAEGMDSLENDMYTTKNYAMDGQSFNGSSVRERNIVIYGRLRKRDYKHTLSNFFNPKNDITIEYTNGDISRLIKCKVDRSPAIDNESVYPEFMISLICFKPYWFAQEIKTDIAQWVGAFEFPLEIPEETGILMGYREPSVIVNVNNTSDNPAPMKLEFRAVGTLTNPTIMNVETQEFIKIEREMVAGDVITLSTEKGSEYVRLTRGGVVSNIFNSLTLDSNPHFEIDVGDNLIRYDADTNVENLEVSIYFTPQFVGV